MDAVGGAEQVLSALDRALVAAGHRSIVIACEGSSVAGELLAIAAPNGPLDGEATKLAHAAVQRWLACTPADVVHLHGVDFACYLPPPGPPVLATLHLPPSWYPAEALNPQRAATWLHCVSTDQHRALQALPHSSAVLPPIENGVDIDALGAVRHASRAYAMMLGRVCPEKGQHTALQAAHLAGSGMLIGGQVFPYPSHEAYFAADVAPLLDWRRRFLGPLGFARKRRLLAGARCLLVPSTAPETSSLVAMEAMACGTPVVAYPAGALASLVEDGRTGFLVDTPGGMADAILRAGSIDREQCREVARDRFSQAHMIASYFAVYRSLAA